MSFRRILDQIRRCAVVCLAVSLLSASEFHGVVNFGGLPVPGATVTASQGDKTFTAITDPRGAYSFPDLPDGTWSIQVEMPGFQTVKEDVAIAPNAPAAQWDLKMLPLDQMRAAAAPAPAPSAAPAPLTTQVASAAAKPPDTSTSGARAGKKGQPLAPTNTQTPFQRTDVNAASSNAPNAAANDNAPAGDAAPNQNVAELNQRAADGFLINGTQNNGASSPFALSQAFGNNRRGMRSLYNGNFGVIVDNSSFDARNFSLTGQDTPRPAYNHFQGVAAFGGPIKIPHLVRNNGPQFFVNYQWLRNRNVTTPQGLMPSSLERAGDFSQALTSLGLPVQITDPTSGLPFPGNVIPQSRISPQAAALLSFYPLPNFAGGAGYNYQIPVVGIQHQDSMQSRLNKTIGRKNQLSGTYAFQSTRSSNSNPNLFGFPDTTDSLGQNLNTNWRHNVTQRFFINLGYQFTRFATRLTPYFENRENVSGAAGISGNNQEAVNWGPPALSFAASGIAGLSDALPNFTHIQTSVVSMNNLWNHSGHNVSFGGDFRRQQFNILSQTNPRGTFSFTGAAAGYDFADFLLGVPDTSSIAYGNADKYFRASSYDAFVSDDWRLSPGFTLNAGIRWEYWSPVTELYGRLVNLDITPGFSAEAPVVASNPLGTITGQKYPDSLMQPDKHGFQPRIAFSWRPFPASSMVVRGGYGVYYNTSVYEPITLQMAQQSPLSKSLSVPNSAADPLTLANGFNASPSVTPDTFSVNPNFLIGYSQNWQLSAQRDLPGSLVLTTTYIGSKGTRAMQEFLPNTYPAGAVNPCPTCPTGFVYLTSNGNSTREAGQIQLRRRLHNGFTSTVQYTLSKSIDDAALGGRNQGGSVIAQNWLDLGAERALSNFDQRQLATVQIQYTTGMGIGGGALVAGWRGALFKQWTFLSSITAGSGLPLTPIYGANIVPGTGVTQSIRPDYTGAPLYAASGGLSLNPAAYAAPPAGQWGNAGRNSITGPSQFSLNASMGRIFQVNDRFSLDFRVDATNALNHVTFSSWNTTVTSGLFGLPNPNSANAMRSLQTTLRLRF